MVRLMKLWPDTYRSHPVERGSGFHAADSVVVVVAASLAGLQVGFPVAILRRSDCASQSVKGLHLRQRVGQEEEPEADAASSLFQFPGPTRVESRGRGSRAIGADPLGYCHTLSPKGFPELLWEDCRCRSGGRETL